MKNFLSKSNKVLVFFFVALIVFNIFPKVSFADTNEAGEAAAVVQTLNTQNGQATSPSVKALATGPTVAPAGVTSAADGCNLFNIGDCVAISLAVIALHLAGFAGWLLGVVGSIFNWIVVITVFQFGSYFGNSVGLLTAWGILRDLGNILLLFGFIFMGILMILDLESFSAGKSIARLIIVAVLLNFSLFAAEAVIDVANVLSASIYNQAGSTVCTSAVPAACANTGIALQVINASGLTGVFSSFDGYANALAKIGSDPWHQMVVYIGLALFMSVTMVVLLAATVMFVIRAVVLVFVMVLAPLGFAAMAIPPFANLGKQWRDMLISQAFFAPAYLLLLLVSLKIMSAVKTSFTTNNPPTLLDALSTPSATFATIFIVFALVMGFMIAALMTAKKMGAIGADFATSVATKTVRGGVLAPVRLGGMVAKPVVRQVGGGLATKFGQNYDTTLGKWRESDNLFKRSLAKTTRLVGLDDAIVGGVEGVRNAKMGNNRSFAEQEKHVKERTQHLTHAAEIDHLRTEVKGGITNKADGEDDAAYADRKDKAERALNKMDQSDREDLIKQTKDETQRKNLAKMLTADAFDKTMESKEIDAQTKEKLVKYHYADAAEALRRQKLDDGDPNKMSFDEFKKVIRDLPEKEKKLMARHRSDLFKEVISVVNPANGEATLSAEEANKFSKDDSFTATQRAEIKRFTRASQLKDAVERGDTEYVETLMKNINTEGADIGEGLFTTAGTEETQKAILSNLNSTIMTKMMAKGEMSESGKAKVIEYWAQRGKDNPEDAAYKKIRNYLEKGNAAGWWGSLPPTLSAKKTQDTNTVETSNDTSQQNI